MDIETKSYPDVHCTDDPESQQNRQVLKGRTLSSQHLLKKLSGTGKVPCEEYQQSPGALSDYKTAYKHVSM